ncbi:unnamed protein product [Blepharisma stoltei]|uniref:Transmembrane protein n=1 Tax=Blepharisma stoltei TaxID=1481888 RepID=A0AAU9K5W1_9CILI|nr:unnamed protein product [Blepharisma stoltei]
MAETKFERVIRTLNSIFCDWGWSTVIKPKDGNFVGNTAPLWRSPSPFLYLVVGVFNLITFFLELLITSFAVDFKGSCQAAVTYFRNILIFFFLLNGLWQFYMSRWKIGTDKQWCRYLTVSTVLNSLLLLFSILVIIALIADSACSSDDSNSYNISVSLIALGLLSGGCYTGLIAYSITKLYFRGNPLAYNSE